MLRIAATQFLTHLEIRFLPKVSQVFRQLHRLETRREQFHKQRLLAVVYGRRIGQAETLLKPYADHRSLGTLTIVDADARTRRNGDVSRCETVE